MRKTHLSVSTSMKNTQNIHLVGVESENCEYIRAVQSLVRHPLTPRKVHVYL